jgi:hypothetical protein
MRRKLLSISPDRLMHAGSFLADAPYIGRD